MLSDPLVYISILLMTIPALLISSMAMLITLITITGIDLGIIKLIAWFKHPQLIEDHTSHKWSGTTEWQRFGGHNNKAPVSIAEGDIGYWRIVHSSDGVYYQIKSDYSKFTDLYKSKDANMAFSHVKLINPPELKGNGSVLWRD